MKRSRFLLASAAAGGALVIGPARSRAAAAFEPTPWVRLEPGGGATITVHVSELGQGVNTGLAMLLADELDLDWRRVRVVTAGADGKRYGNQGIGGSRTMRTSAKKFRTAGAATRSVLVAAAARRWGVEPASCTTRDGTVRHAASGRSVAYAELLTDAAQLPLPQSPALKARSELRIVGKPRPLLEARDKSSGRAVYAMDVRRPGMLVAVVERAPHAGATIAAVHDDAARTIPGVHGIVRLDTNPYPDQFVWPGVAVLARDTWSALAGRRALRVNWADGPDANADSDAVRARLIALLDAPAALTSKSSKGDVRAALADKTIEATYESPIQCHAQLEPSNALADVRVDRCEIWAPTQSPDDVLGAARAVTGFPANAIQVHQTLAGGGFGRRSEIDPVVEALQLSKRMGRPVRVMYTREDDMTHDFYRMASMNRLRGTLAADGSVTSVAHRYAGPTIGLQRGYSKAGELDDEALEGLDRPLYEYPAYLLEAVQTADFPVRIGWWRAVSVVPNAFAAESFIDELAHAAGRDPLAFRLALLAQGSRARGVLTAVAERARWSDSTAAGGVARGISLTSYGATPVAQIVEARIEGGAIRVPRVTCAIDCGMIVNPSSVIAQVQGGIAWALGAALKHKITLAHGRAQQTNFATYPMLRLHEMPQVDVVLVDSDADPSAVGEASVPGLAPALGNALFALTGRRLRSTPFIV
ncbi:MAG: molybdopterin-binding xanthine dehydrogenase [Candidatus Eremiobacteraeota bacterium]|nr:molybdopterin-binding xanthine dehydrogenase [Candidatus Eremiobacteraeota bacterium]